MPSFDVVSEIDLHEARNAVDQASREVDTRFDFKGSGAKFELNEAVVTMTGQSEFQLEQMRDILYAKLARRGIDLACVELGKMEQAGKEARQTVTLRQGIDADLGRKIVKLIKDQKMKVQASIMGDKIRVTGKKRDDLQEAIRMLREQELGMPLQFNNFRD
ncbi:MAG TPA: YajQ family cyclic di-GMP-binding protein [Gammaproteobacteria bacterium]|nr:YajQ family cyclic di-GMP-binding protein [Gammaproteobacteria bacterium]